MSGLLSLALILMFLTPVESTALTPNDFFGVKVVDLTTGKGIPMVELRTRNDIRYYTDNAGIAAIYEPGLMNRKIRLSLESSGYESSGPGWEKETTVRFTPGRTMIIEMKPQNIAQRRYRQNGYGMYRDSHLLGKESPLRNPLMNNGHVMGQDSVNNAVFRGELYWFWDDTHRTGNHWLSRGSGATSRLPSRGGLNPQEGVDLNHFVDDHGTVMNLFSEAFGSWIWMTGLMVLEDASGVERMYSIYFNVDENELGLAQWNDRRKTWTPTMRFPNDHKIEVGSMRVFRVKKGDREWFYFAAPYPTVRVPATEEAITDPDRYEALTPLEPGSDISDGAVERDDEGNPLWGWKTNTPSLHSIGRRKQLKQLDEFDTTYGLGRFRDVHTDKRLRTHRGTVYWNQHRGKWIMIFNQVFGQYSLLGDLWYSEADSPIGPWTYARRIVRHRNRSCYNVKQHRMFDQLEGQRVFFECTHSSMFSRGQQSSNHAYNQIMYSLDLSDTRLHLPTPVYHYQDAVGRHRYDTLKGLSDGPGEPLGSSSRPGSISARGSSADSVANRAPIPFYALPADRPRPGSVPVWRRTKQDGVTQLTLDPTARRERDSPVFYAFPPDTDAGRPHLVTVNEYEHRTSGRRRYSTTSPGTEWRHSGSVFQAWESPNAQPPRESSARPVTSCMGASAVCQSTPR